MKPLDNFVSIRGVYARSVNLLRDSDDLDIVRAYLPTAKTLQTLEQFKSGFTKHSAERSFALIGPYGSGKSAFALFLSSLLAKQESPQDRLPMTNSRRLTRLLRPPLIKLLLMAAVF